MGHSGLAYAASGAEMVLLLLAAVLALRDGRSSTRGRLLAALAISLVALELATGPQGALLPTPLWYAARVVGGPNIALLWLFCLSLLRDDFRLRQRECVTAVLFSVGPLSTMVTWPSTPAFAVFGALVGLAPLVMIAHVMWSTLTTSSAGHRTRLLIPLGLVLATFVSVASETFDDVIIASLFRNFGAALPATLALLLWLTVLEQSELHAEPDLHRQPPLDIDPRDQVLLTQLRAAMERGVYREPGLTIEALAERLSTPTHRLRALINQGLGNRNFASFVNGYRLAQARAALADPLRARENVLTIAFEAGFSSLQTFNRVFKEAEGETPSSFRDKRLTLAAQNQKLLPDS